MFARATRTDIRFSALHLEQVPIFEPVNPMRKWSIMIHNSPLLNYPASHGATSVIPWTNPLVEKIHPLLATNWPARGAVCRKNRPSPLRARCWQGTGAWHCRCDYRNVITAYSPSTLGT